ncbi:hypothetical protein DID76_01460 [Candidatus Marinamargulisbacteria bacterium SCGC AG-414-C22]|nr:hypothetical protein DID76_01460 [Candidatus Marinamargulisbacteria bacterium SCGC AG-414-C22]
MTTQQKPHSFHIPVMGTAFTIDTPFKVAKFGISSVVSIVDDELCEEMRQHYSNLYNEPYEPIKKFDDDFRARRITGYLNLLNKLINQQIETIKGLSFDDSDNDLNKYFDMLPDTSPTKALYKTMQLTKNLQEKEQLQAQLKDFVKPGSIDVNIMTKLDRDNYSKDGELLPQQFSDACAALRGFALSDLDAGIVLSAGFNRRLYAYIEEFPDFFPDETGYLKKRVILKVSDFRSSQTQGKFLAKKGIWVAEHRIESGLNCGGHAFASDGYLLGPILDEFKQKRSELISSLYVLCNQVLKDKEKQLFHAIPELLITVQGGIGTANENEFLFTHYNIDNTGWASPFLLVPEATLLDNATRSLLSTSGEGDFYLSGVSPLGVPFNTVRNTASEQEKLRRFRDGRPGSPCPKGHLISNTEFSKKRVCTASIFFQKRKLKEIDNLNLSKEAHDEAVQQVIQKSCLCEDLAAGALLKNDISNKRPLHSAVCPGPNLTYFSKISSLKDMVSHIYGRLNLLNDTYRPNMFMSELKMYINYFKKEVHKALNADPKKQKKYLHTFQDNLYNGIDYYSTLIPTIINESLLYREKMETELNDLKQELTAFIQRHQAIFSVLTTS